MLIQSVTTDFKVIDSNILLPVYPAQKSKPLTESSLNLIKNVNRLLLLTITITTPIAI